MAHGDGLVWFGSKHNYSAVIECIENTKSDVLFTDTQMTQSRFGPRNVV